MDNLKDDRYYVGEAIKDIDKILAYAKRADFSDIEANGEAMDAIAFRLNMLRHHIEGLSEDFLRSHGDLGLQKIVVFRDAVTHDYEHVNFSSYRDFVKKDLPKIRKGLLPFLR
jgi:uncharacterized protein with HEPN domain